jgi:hypothetical protein
MSSFILKDDWHTIERTRILSEEYGFFSCSWIYVALMIKFLNKHKLSGNMWKIELHWNCTSMLYHTRRLHPIRQQPGQLVGGMRKLRKGCSMKNHKFWAWATVVCFLITIYTGYKHK